MMRKMIRLMNNKKGFTLIELIVVIAVLGILAAVALPRIGNVVGDAKDNADEQHLRVLNEALERYVATTGDDDLSDVSLDEDAAEGKQISNATTAITYLKTNKYLNADVDTTNLPSEAKVKLVITVDASSITNYSFQK